MPTAVDTTPLSEMLADIKQTAEQALRHESAEDFAEVEHNINQLDAAVRELQQSMCLDELRSAIRHLEKDEPLTPADNAVIRTLLISDAEHYLEHENNFSEWVAEMRRLMQEMEQRVRTLNHDNVADMRGIIKDAVRLVPDIRNYLEEQRRVERFHEAIGQLDRTARENLCRLLREQMRSEKR